MSASLVLGGVGAVIGGIVSYGAGASYGWMIGSAVGALLDATVLKKTSTMQGPRLDDKKIQNSAYGLMIPIIHGTIGVAGNVIWASDLVEISHTESEDGKGGGGMETTVYEYFGNFAVSLGEGPQQAIRRIWANGKLWYDAGSGAATTGQSWKFYPGDEFQLPDPTISSYMGAGNVPAYRGQAYVVFTMIPLAPFGNTLPMLFFEVCETITSTNAVQVVSSKPLTSPQPDRIMYDGGGALWGQPSFGPEFFRIDPYTGAYLARWTATAAVDLMQPAGSGAFWAYEPFGREVWLVDMNARSEQAISDAASPGSSEHIGGWCSRGADLMVMLPNAVNADHVALLISRSDEGIVANSGPLGTSILSGADVRFGTYGATDGTYYFVPAVSTVVSRSYDLYRFTVSDMRLVDVTQCPRTQVGGPINWSSPNNVVFCHGYIFIGTSAGVVDRWDPTTLAFTSLAFTTPGQFAYVARTEQDDLLVSTAANGWTCDPDTFTTPELFTGLTYSDTYARTRDPLTGRVMLMRHGGVPTALELCRVRTGILNEFPVEISALIMDYCQRVGLDASTVDVSGLGSATLRGSVVGRQITARSAIEPIASAFYFDGVESDAKIKFRFRGAAPTLTIPAEDLVAERDAMPFVQIKRMQDADLPRTVNINHYDPARDYQTGTQYARRLTGESTSDLSAEIPISMSADEAKAIAETWLYNAWAERALYTWSTSRRYSLLEPSDVITVADRYVTRINKRSEDGSVVKWEGVGDASQIYLQDAPGAVGEGGGQEVPQPHPSEVLYLDMPLLRDQDDEVGFYLAAAGLPAGNWPGAAVFKSNDGGETWGAFYAITAPSTIGSAADVLGDFDPLLNIFDELNSVTIYLESGDLSSTSELAVLNGANAALLGAEVLQFKIATLISEGVVKLSGLLRGRQGTEWAMGGHIVGERFVALTTNLRNVSLQTYELDLPRDYKATTIGYPLDMGTETRFTDTGVRHECYAPVELGGGTNPSGDWLLSWHRRTRLSDGWHDYVDAPLGEATEAYEVEILDGGLIARTVTGLSSPSLTYTAAQQTTDFGAPQTSLTWRVYQLSALRGRGYPGEVTL